MSWMRLVVSAIAGTGLLAACGTSASSGAASGTVAEGCRVASGINAHATTKSYVVQIDIGSVETMYSPAEVAAQHPTTGEVMVRGQMSDVGAPMAGMPGMGATDDPNAHHLEAHICSKATGTVIQDANPTITLVNDADKSVTQNVQIAVMQGVTSGVSDLHYGNNVTLTPAASYTVLVVLNGETATLHIQTPPATSVTTAGGSPTTVAAKP